MRASLQDIPLIISTIFVGAVSIFIVYHILTQFGANPTIAALDTSAITSRTITAFTIFDFMLVFAMVSMVGVIAILASTIDTHLAYLPFGIIISMGFTIVAYSIKQAFTTFITVPSMNTVAGNFPNVVLLFSNLEVVTAVACIIVLIALFGKKAGGPQYGSY